MSKWVQKSGLFLVVVLAVLLVAACGNSSMSIQGSDTMVNLGQAWAEHYMDEVDTSAQIVVTGGGSGTGIAAMINDDVDIAQASRPMRDSEFSDAEDNGVDVYEFVVGQDGVAVYTHLDNPIEDFTMEQLKDIFTGVITDWSELGWEDGGEISVFSRQSNSGTHVFFNEVVMDEEDWAPGTNFSPGSSALVEGVSQTVGGIGYSGAGYADGTTNVPTVEGFSPLVEADVLSAQYPVARPLYFYVNGKPEGAVKEYLDWVLQSNAAKSIIDDQGFFGIGAYQDANQDAYKKAGIDW